MSSLIPLNSRRLSSGFAQRTLKNLEFIQSAYDSGADVHIVTELVNSLLGLLVFPVEKESVFFDTPCWTSVTLSNPPDFETVRLRIPEFPRLPSLKVVQFENCDNLGRFFKRLRNSIAHRLLDFSNDSRDLPGVTITMRDRPKNKPINWEIEMTVEDLGRLCRYVADRVIAQNL